MATNTIPSPCPKSNLTRRQALVSTAACGALVLPAGAAMAAAAGGTFCHLGTDPHVAWWAELVEVRAAIDGRPANEEVDEDVSDRESELERLIAQTAPTTHEGALVVAAMIASGHQRMYPDGRGMAHIEPEDRAGETLAQWFLAGAGLEV